MGRFAEISREAAGAPPAFSAVAIIDAERRRGRGRVDEAQRPFRERDARGGRRRLGVAGEPSKRSRRISTGEAAHDHYQERFARHFLRPLDQSLSWLRTWLRLLLRAADARLYGLFSGPRLRDGDFRERRRGATAGARIIGVGLRAQNNRDRLQHRSLSAGRKSHRVMRSILEVLARANHPVAIVTKSALVLRDLDLLAAMAEKGLAKVAISVTTLDPQARPPHGAARRDADLPDGDDRKAQPTRACPSRVMTARSYRRSTTTRSRRYLRARTAPARARRAMSCCVCRSNCGSFQRMACRHFPDRARRALSLVRSTRGRQALRFGFRPRMKGDGPYAWMIGRRFEVAAERLGFSHVSCAPTSSSRRVARHGN